VYDTYIRLSHRTLPSAETPQEEIYNIAWKVSKHPSVNIKVVPGIYELIIETTVDEEEMIMKGTIRVVE